VSPDKNLLLFNKEIHCELSLSQSREITQTHVLDLCQCDAPLTQIITKDVGLRGSRCVGECVRGFLGVDARSQSKMWYLRAAKQMVSFQVYHVSRTFVVTPTPKSGTEADDRSGSRVRYPFKEHPRRHGQSADIVQGPPPGTWLDIPFKP
jgi:hypothetical protein